MKRFVIPCTRGSLQCFAVTRRHACVFSAALSAAPIAAAQAAADAVSGGMGTILGELLLAMLLALCAWTVFYVWRRKRLGALGGDERMQVVSVAGLGARERVVILRVRERTLLLGVTPAQITLLAELEGAPRAAAEQAAATQPTTTQGLNAPRSG
jgi:flagellar protein FliO/FliZ